MKKYNYSEALALLWQKAVKLYEGGKRDASKYFSAKEKAVLKSMGITPHEVYDYAEDHVSYGEPDMTTFILVHSVRRAYFLNQQKGKWSKKVIKPEKLPAKSDQLDGITWLPRIIAKARAKLRGELDPNIMYGCGGDRAFLKAFDIHPKDFLSFVWWNDSIDKKDDKAIARWVKKQK